MLIDTAKLHELIKANKIMKGDSDQVKEFENALTLIEKIWETTNLLIEKDKCKNSSTCSFSAFGCATGCNGYSPHE